MGMKEPLLNLLYNRAKLFSKTPVCLILQQTGVFLYYQTYRPRSGITDERKINSLGLAASATSARKLIRAKQCL
jgi:hypothetical protein